MTKILLVAALSVLAGASDPIWAADDAKGAVVIGIKGEVIGVKATQLPDFIWRPFDPATGKLSPFSVPSNLAKNTGKALSTLFGRVGRLGGEDKRYAPNGAGVHYHISELPPGTYVLEATNIMTSQKSFMGSTPVEQRAVFEGTVPIVRITAGRTSYVGDYTVEVMKKEGGRITAAGHAIDDARAFMAKFPKMGNPVSEGGGTATLDCRGKDLLLAGQLVCDADRSTVKDINLPGDGR